MSLCVFFSEGGLYFFRISLSLVISLHQSLFFLVIEMCVLGGTERGRKLYENGVSLLVLTAV